MGVGTGLESSQVTVFPGNPRGQEPLSPHGFCFAFKGLWSHGRGPGRLTQRSRRWWRPAPSQDSRCTLIRGQGRRGTVTAQRAEDSLQTPQAPGGEGTDVRRRPWRPARPRPLGGDEAKGCRDERRPKGSPLGTSKAKCRP